MSKVTYSSKFQAREDHVFVADFRISPASTEMVGQLATWSAGKWYLARTPFVEMLDIKAGQTPEGVYKAALAEALTTLKSVLRSDGIETHPVLDIGELPQEAVDLSMDERQLAFVSHVLGWGHLRSARCRFCDRYEAKK